MTIKHVIIHVVMRDESTGVLHKQLRTEENKIKSSEKTSEALAEKLTNDLRNLFGTASLSIGEFGMNGNNTLKPAFEQTLETFYETAETCSDFVQLTRRFSEQYYAILMEENLTTVKGGYLVFYQYTARGQEWLAVVILNKTEGIDVNSTSLEVVPSEILDLKTLHLAASINLTKWMLGDDSRYIRFKTGRAAQIRDYFEKFIGCQRDKYAAVVETHQLKEAVQNFAKESGYNEEKVANKVDKTHQFIIERQKDQEPVLLKALANAVFPDLSEEFEREARDTYNLSEEISIDKKELKKYVKIFVQSKAFSMSFERDLVGKQIFVVNNEVRISQPPELLINAINEELESRK
jgi:nucleoid-associated protein